MSNERLPRDTAVVTPSASRPGETMARVASSPGAGASTPLPERLGPYEIRGTLGAGGMGVVYRGYDARLDRHVAVKTLPAELARIPEYRERFLREARAMAKVVHRNVVQVHHAGEDGDTPFFAMEQIEGRTVLELVRDQPLEVAVALDVVAQAATGLQAAFERGLIHRDIKPSNLMRGADGTVKVLDFGLARAQSQARITATDIVMGSAEYMSPEQGRGEEPDHRSDIYALGGTLFHLLTGHPPFEGTSPLALIQKHIHETCRQVDELRPGVPEPVCRLVARMLAKDPERRPQAYGELIAELRKASGEDPQEKMSEDWHARSPHNRFGPFLWALVRDPAQAMTREVLARPGGEVEGWVLRTVAVGTILHAMSVPAERWGPHQVVLYLVFAAGLPLFTVAASRGLKRLLKSRAPDRELFAVEAFASTLLIGFFAQPRAGLAALVALASFALYLRARVAGLQRVLETTRPRAAAFALVTLMVGALATAACLELTARAVFGRRYLGRAVSTEAPASLPAR